MSLKLTRRELLAAVGPAALTPPFTCAGAPLQSPGPPLEAAPARVFGELSKDKWEITLSFPQDTYIPDLSSLGKVFKEGENAVGRMADATRNFSNISDASKIGALIKPHAAAVQNSVDAVSGIAKANAKGGPSFGFKLGSPEPGSGEQGMPGGVQGSVVFTYVF